MDVLTLARWQFAITTIYHFLFVPLTLGFTLALALMETQYVRTGNEKYKKMVLFWGKMFLVNFAVGVATGIVQEFQFGMNWSEFSRFVGDVFGVPLAIEALLAFFLESTFLGIWIFGWDKLSKKKHCATMWIVALGSNLSAIWILVANSFMQQPVGFQLVNGRAEMIDFFALLTSGHVWVQFPHVFFAGVTTAAFFIIAVSIYQLKKNKNQEVFRTSFKFGIIFGFIGTLFVSLVGHSQAQYMIKVQPMKMAAAEALWESENPASMSLFTIGDEKNREDVFAIKIPGGLSFLAYNEFEGEVKGIKNLQAEYEEKYGPGDYVPPVAISYWTFRMMVGAGSVMFLILFIGWWVAYKKDFEFSPLIYKVLLFSISLPFIANSTGWIFTEVGRQPWTVFGLYRIEDSVSKAATAGEVLFTTIGFTLLYGALLIPTIYLWRKFAIKGTDGLEIHESTNTEN
jgi:cytochrome bd ubiquinol oxidase subunit I